MNNSPFKKSSLNEMCKQIVSAPVIFKMKDGTECLAFYNHKDSIQATKLYILFPDTSTPKYIEGNDLYNLRESIIHGITKTQGIFLYAKSGMLIHKESTRNFIEQLINQAPVDHIQPESIKPSSVLSHTVYSKKHACVWALYQGKPIVSLVKDLKNTHASECIVNNEVVYNVTFDCVYWAASISSQEFTSLKVTLKELRNA